MTDPAAERGSPIAVTVIGGYLGSGKTTMLNDILRRADERIAVIVNDFGDINIDADLITSQDDQMLSLANGCICCSLVDGFAAALSTIRALDPKPDRLVIEASGVADPAQVAAYGHAPGLAVDAVVVLVDAETGRRRSVDRYVGDTVLRQLAAANIIVLNKADLVDDASAADTRDWLRDGWPEAMVVDAQHGRVPRAVLFGSTMVSDNLHSHDHEDHHHPESVFETATITRDEPLQRRAIQELIDALPDSMIRVKGIIQLDDDRERQSVLQRVGRRWSLTRGAEWSGPPTSRLVFIGTNIDVKAWLDGYLSEHELT